MLSPSFAQNIFKRDTTKPSTRNDTWFHGHEPEVRYSIDTSIVNFEEFNPIYRQGAEYVNTGNLGSAAFPLVYETDKTIGFNAGYNQFDLYRYKKDSIRYYQVVRPYTELQMVIGLRNEQFFQGRFANQHKKLIYYGVEFRRMFSRGAYTNQRTNDNGFSLYGHYTSRNRAWSVHADLVFNAFKVQENGGVTDSVFEKSYLQKSLVPVSLSEAENNYMQTDFYLTGMRHIGKKVWHRENDTTSYQVVAPQFSVYYLLNIEKNKFSYRDQNPDKDYYNRFFLADSVFNDLDYLKAGNTLRLQYNMLQFLSDSSFRYRNLTASFEATYDYYTLTQNKIGRAFGNLHFKGEVKSNAASGSALVYKATAQYFAYGYNAHDFMADASVGYSFGKWANLSADFTFLQKEVPYIFENYTSHPAEWSFQFPKFSVLSAGVKFQSPKLGIVADAHFNRLKNLPVYAGSSDAYGTLGSGEQNGLVAHAGNRHAIAGMHFDNDIWINVFSKGFIRETHPLLFTRHSLYYEARVFKKALWLSTGVDIRFRYLNNTPYYDPLLARFYPAFSPDKYTLRLDYFLNFKIRTVRVFLKLENILGAFSKYGHYSLYDYPAADFSFKAGINWRFFE